MKKYYAVKQGRKPGIYETWDECKMQVDGISGSSYKSFGTLAQAQEFLEMKPSDVISSEKFPRTTSSEAVAYVDGSYDKVKKEFSYGVVMFYDEIEEHFSEKLNTPSLVDMNNVAGEIKAAERAMQFCIDNGIKSLDIYHDYEGIAKWCTGEWKAKKEGTKDYKGFYDSIKNKLKVNFIKVEGHSGDRYNDLADALAKSALGLEKVPDITQRTNSMTANNISFDDLNAILELLKNDIKDLVISSYDVPYGKGYRLLINTPTKQKLTVIHFTDKNKIWLQGKKEELFNQLALYIVELLESDEVPQFLNSVYQLQVPKNVVELKFKELLPNAVNNLPEKLNRTLHQAVYNLNTNDALYDASYIATPAIRAVEGILKIALKKYNFPMQKKDTNYDSFFIFTRNGKCDNYILKKQYINRSEHSQELIDYLSVAYTHFTKHRHTLFHWDDPTASIDTTRLLITPGEAHTLIKDTLKIINDYYKL